MRSREEERQKKGGGKPDEPNHCVHRFRSRQTETIVRTVLSQSQKTSRLKEIKVWGVNR